MESRYNKTFYDYAMPVLGLLLFLSELWKQWMLTMQVNGGHYDVWYVPFQLCSLPMYLCLIMAVASYEWKKRIQIFLMSFTLLGGLAAYLDTTGMKYPMTALTVHSYCWHIVIIVIGVWSGIEWCQSREERCKDNRKHWFRAFAKCLPIWFASLGIATVLNIGLHSYGEINMFYISPLEPSYQKYVHEVAMKIGIHASNLLYLLAMCLGAMMLFSIWCQINFSQF